MLTSPASFLASVFILFRVSIILTIHVHWLFRRSSVAEECLDFFLSLYREPRLVIVQSFCLASETLLVSLEVCCNAPQQHYSHVLISLQFHNNDQVSSKWCPILKPTTNIRR